MSARYADNIKKYRQGTNTAERRQERQERRLRERKDARRAFQSKMRGKDAGKDIMLLGTARDHILAKGPTLTPAEKSAALSNLFDSMAKYVFGGTVDKATRAVRMEMLVEGGLVRELAKWLHKSPYVNGKTHMVPAACYEVFSSSVLILYCVVYHVPLGVLESLQANNSKPEARHKFVELMNKVALSINNTEIQARALLINAVLIRNDTSPGKVLRRYAWTAKKALHDICMRATANLMKLDLTAMTSVADYCRGVFASDDGPMADPEEYKFLYTDLFVPVLITHMSISINYDSDIYITCVNVLGRILVAAQKKGVLMKHLQVMEEHGVAKILFDLFNLRAVLPCHLRCRVATTMLWIIKGGNDTLVTALCSNRDFIAIIRDHYERFSADYHNINVNGADTDDKLHAWFGMYQIFMMVGELCARALVIQGLNMRLPQMLFNAQILNSFFMGMREDVPMVSESAVYALMQFTGLANKEIMWNMVCGDSRIARNINQKKVDITVVQSLMVYLTERRISKKSNLVGIGNGIHTLWMLANCPDIRVVQAMLNKTPGQTNHILDIPAYLDRVINHMDHSQNIDCIIRKYAGSRHHLAKATLSQRVRDVQAEAAQVLKTLVERMQAEDREEVHVRSSGWNDNEDGESASNLMILPASSFSGTRNDAWDNAPIEDMGADPKAAMSEGAFGNDDLTFDNNDGFDFM